jgi:hypothetical protein
MIRSVIKALCWSEHLKGCAEISILDVMKSHLVVLLHGGHASRRRQVAGGLLLEALCRQPERPGQPRRRVRRARDHKCPARVAVQSVNQPAGHTHHRMIPDHLTNPFMPWCGIGCVDLMQCHRD